MRKMLLLAFALLLPFSVDALLISEIMYNPIQSDSYNEWIELYADSDIDLSGASICGYAILPGYIDRNSKTIQRNGSTFLPKGSYAVITDGGSGTEAYSNFTMDGLAFHTDSPYLCANGLKNSGSMEIVLRKDGIILDNITYDASLASEGRSISRKDGAFSETEPTPGRENVFSAREQLAPEEAEMEMEKPAPEKEEYCVWKISIALDKEVLSPKDTFSFKVKAEKVLGGKANLSADVLIVSQDGRILEKHHPFTDHEATVSKTSSAIRPKAQGNVTIKAFLRSSCGTIESSSSSEKVVEILKMEEKEPAQESKGKAQDSHLAIDDFSFERSEAKVSIYRGNTSKYAVYFSALSDGKKISDAVLKPKEKFSDLEASLSIPLPSCAANITIALDGLSSHTEKSFLRNASCVKEGNVSSGPALSQKKTITGDAILRNNDAKAGPIGGNLALILFLIVSLAANIALVWRK